MATKYFKLFSKKSMLTLLLLAGTACSAFAGGNVKGDSTNTVSAWVEPAAPAFEPMATDGETVQYLYNVEAKGFFLGANDWNTRASISKTKGYQVKMTPQDECEDLDHKHWIISNYVESRANWHPAFADSWSGIWVDGYSGSSNTDNWVVIPQDNNTYKIYNCGISYDDPSYSLGLAEIFRGEKGNTRLWLYDPTVTYYYVNEDDEECEGKMFQGEFYDKWAFVSPAEYEAYIEQSVVYEAAMKLQEALEEAKAEFPGANFADVEAVFNNTSSSVEELDEARIVLVPLAISKYQAEHVSANDPQDMTRMVPNYDFESSTSGWSFTTGAQNKGGATNKANSNDYPGTTMTGTFLENWNPDPFAGKIYTKVADLPGGIYRIEMDATANGGSDTWVYANKSITRTGGVDANGEGDKEIGDTAYKFHVMTCLNDGDTLEIGLENKSVCCNWIGIDNVKLTYYGAGLDAYQLWYKTVRAEIISRMNSLITDGINYDRNQKAIFNKALADGDAADTKEALMAAVENLADAADAAAASIEAYKQLAADVEKMIDVLDTKDLAGLIEYFNDMVRPENVTGDGSSDLETIYENAAKYDGYEELIHIDYAPNYIMEEGLYNTEELKAYTVNLQKLFDFCVANSVQPGDDYTFFIKDADFKDPNGTGWTRDKGSITWRGGFHAFPVAESYHSAFDFYQEVSAPNGIYSLSLNGFCRPDDGETEPAAEIYMNDFATTFQSLDGGAIPDDENAKDGFNCYKTKDASAGVGYMANPIFAKNPAHNSPANNTDRIVEGGLVPDGMEGASIAFSANRYQAKVYGLVENGKIRLGARCNSSNQWVLWGNFKLVYEGESEEALKALAESYTRVAQQYLDENIGNMSEPAANALGSAIQTVINGETAAEIKEAIKAMNAEIENAKANVAAILEFSEAKESMWMAAEWYGDMASNETLNTFVELADVEYHELTTAQIIEYTTQFLDCAAMLRIPVGDDASDDNPMDVSQVIINPDFEDNRHTDYEGWTLVLKEGASGNYMTQYGFDGGKSMEFWSNTNGSDTKFDFYQDIKNLPAGTYELTVDAANSLNDQNQKNNGRAYIYAGKGTSNMNYVNANPIDIQEEDCQNKYGNYSVIINLEEGETLRIGATNVGDLAARWVMVDNFRLIYYGKNSSKIESSGMEVQDELSVGAPYELNIEFAEGWNWISINAPIYAGVWDITNQTDSKVDYVADQFNDASFSYNSNNWYGNLWGIESYSAYKVHATGDCTLRFTYENKRWYSDRIMNPGWNWLSYTVAYPQMVSEALAYYEPTDGDIIKSFDNTAVYSSEEGWIGDFVMNPGEGYLYKSESINDNFFKYNWGVEANVETRTAPRKSHTALTYNPHLYRDNMAVIATVGDDPFGNYSVAAMVGEECRGISKLSGDFQFVTVHGEKRGEEITFYLIDNISGNIYLANETVSFNGASMGTLNSPVTLTAGALIGDTETGIKGAQIAGANDDVYTINGVKAKDANAKGIYIKNGNKVIVK